MNIKKALQKIKQLTRRVERTQNRIQIWASHTSDVEPRYTEDDISKMHQSIGDLLAHIAKLRHAIHVTNATVPVEFKGKTTTIDQLLLETELTIPTQIKALISMRRKEKGYHLANKEIKVLMHYDPVERDDRIEDLEELRAEIHDFIDVMNLELDIVE